MPPSLHEMGNVYYGTMLRCTFCKSTYCIEMNFWIPEYAFVWDCRLSESPLSNCLTNRFCPCCRTLQTSCSYCPWTLGGRWSPGRHQSTRKVCLRPGREVPAPQCDQKSNCKFDVWNTKKMFNFNTKTRISMTTKCIYISYYFYLTALAYLCHQCCLHGNTSR